jgi:hypothetical protein
LDDNLRVECAGEQDNKWGNEEGSSEDDVDHNEADHDGRSKSGQKFKRTFEDVDDDDTNSEMGRSDILV